MAAADLTAARLRELLRYDPDTGLFRWAQTRCGRALQGDIAGRAEARGYWTIHVDGRRYKAHRLAWLYVRGKWPDGQIDHRDGIKANNRLSNLRDVTKTVNMENRREAHSNNRSGLLGVSSQSKGRKKYQARIQVGKLVRSLGYFATPEEAHAAYLEAKRRLHAGCTI